MGISTLALFTTNNLRFTTSKLHNKVREYFDCYFRRLPNDTDIVSFMYQFNNPNFSKLMGYFNKEKLDAWKKLFQLIMKQNSHETNLEIHFYCEELGLAFYFYICHGKFGIRMGEKNDLRYNEIIYKDFNDNVVSKSTYESDPENHILDYIFDLDRYKINYYSFTYEYI